MRGKIIKERSTISHREQVRHLEVTYKNSTQATQSSKDNVITSSKTESMSLPEIDNGEEHTAFFDSPSGALRRILEIARDPKQCEKISKKDIDIVFKECSVDHIKKYYIATAILSFGMCAAQSSLRKDRKVLVKMGLSIFMYIAKYGKKRLENRMISMLLEYADVTDFNLSSRALMGLGYAINNGQKLTLTEHKKIFQKGIQRLFHCNKRNTEYLFEVTVGLLAFAKMEINLTSEELNFLLDVLSRSDKNAKNEYTIAVLLVKNENFKATSRTKNQLVSAGIFQRAEFRNLKNIAKNGITLTYNDFIYLVHRFNKCSVSDVKGRRKILHVFYNAVCNTQLDIPVVNTQDNFIDLLKNSLESNDFEIKKYALTTAAVLFNSNRNDRFNALQEDISLVVEPLIEFILSTINHHLEHHKNNKLPNDKLWLTTIKHLCEYPQSKIKNIAKFICARLEDKMDLIESLILDPFDGLAVIQMMLAAANNGTVLSQMALINLGTILKDQRYSLKMKQISFATLFKAAENRQKIQAEVVGIVISEFHKLNDSSLEELFSFIGFALRANSEAFNEAILEFCYDNLVQVSKPCIDNKKHDLIVNILFALINTFQAQKTKCNHFDTEKLFLLLVNNLLIASSDSIRENAASLIHDLMKSFYMLLPACVGQISFYLTREKVKPIRLIYFDIIMLYFEKSNFENISNQLISDLISLLTDSDEEIRNNSCHILMGYIQKTNYIFSHTEIEILDKTIRIESSRFVIIALLHSITQKQKNISLRLLESLSDCLLIKELDINLKYAILDVFSLQLDKHNLSSQVIEGILTLIADKTELDLKSKAIRIVQLALKINQENTIKPLLQTRDAISALIDYTAGISHQTTSIYDALIAIKIACENGYKLDLDELHKLVKSISLFNTSESILLIQCIQYQIKYYSNRVYSNESLNKIYQSHKEQFNITATSIEKLISNIQLQDTVVQFLYDVVEIGFQVQAENLIYIIKILNKNPDYELRKKAAVILVNASGNKLTEEQKRIKDLEIVTQNFDSTDSTYKKLECLRKLAETSKLGFDVTLNNLISIEYAVNDERLSDFAVSVAYQISLNSQLLSQSLLIFFQTEMKKFLNKILETINKDKILYTVRLYLSQTFALNKLSKSQHKIIHLLANAVINGQHVDDEIFELFELLICNIEIGEPQHYDAYFKVMMIGLNRFYKLHPDTINKLKKLLKKSEHQFIIGQILKSCALYEGEDLNKETVKFYLLNNSRSNHQETKDAFESSWHELLKQTCKDNAENVSLQKYLDLNGDFSTLMKEIHEIYTSPSRSKDSSLATTSIKKWEREDIQKWAKYIKPYASDPMYLGEILAVIKRACILWKTDHDPRSVQFLTIFTLLASENKKGRIVRVPTGQGKSLVIATLAVIKALRGQSVDIVTINEDLAKRDVKEYRDFYKMFNLDVASNEDDARGYDNSLKPCYNCPIVYGNIHNFQYDMLRHKFSFLKTRGKRKFEAVIVDEVDSLLIDEAPDLAMLAETMPGTNSLQTILTAMWHELLLIASRIKLINDSIYFYEVSDVNMTNPIIISDLRSFIVQKLEEYGNKITDDKNKTVPQYPIQLNEYIKRQIHSWAKSAYAAMYAYQFDQKYTHENELGNPETITPIDNQNTGVLQKGTNLGDGLHQFLQLKHGIRISSETLVTNYISNIAYINLYKDKTGKSNLYGLTGTLGSDASKNMLAENYNVDFCYIPPHKPSLFKERSGSLVETKSEWLDKVSSVAISTVRNGQIALILCESREEANDIAAKLRQDNFNGTLQKYIDSNGTAADFLKEQQAQNTIIVATNLAGRGADIKLHPNVIGAGGLHIIFTFLPINKRVEDQGYGRSARRGEPGSGELILRRDQVNDYLHEVMHVKDRENKNLTIARIKELRNELELKNLNKFKIKKLIKIKNKDILFKQFIDFLKEIHNRNFYVGSVKENLTHVIKGEFYSLYTKIVEKTHRAAIEERWGLWLKYCRNYLDLEKLLNDVESIKTIFKYLKTNSETEKHKELAKPYLPFISILEKIYTESEGKIAAVQQLNDLAKTSSLYLVHYELGDCYMHNRGICKNNQQAFNWYERFFESCKENANQENFQQITKHSIIFNKQFC